MTGEITLPSTLSYIIAMFFNQNNVAPEGGPLTTVLEYDVFQMLGFTIIPKPDIRPGHVIAWGHITPGGTVANLESM